MCIAACLMKQNVFQQLQGKWSTLGKQKWHTDSVTPASTVRTVTGCRPCSRIGSIWALRIHSLGFSKEQELYKAVVSDNWNIPSAQEAQLQMIDGGCMCSRVLFLPFPEYVCESSMSWILTQCPERKQRQASMSLQANLKLRWMAETGKINQSALYFSITCPVK